MGRCEDGSALFRHDAVTAAEFRWFSPVLIATPAAVLPTCGLALIAVIALLLAVAIIEVPERTRAVGVLLPSQGLLKVRAWRSGQVEAVRVANGEAVVRGQVLLWLRDAQHAPQGAPEAATRLASLQDELRLLEVALRQDLAGIESRLRLNRYREELIAARIAVAEAESSTRSKQAELQAGRSKRLSQLATAGLVAAQSADEIAAQALAARAAGQMAQQTLLALREEAVRLTEQIQRDVAAPQSLRTQTDIRRQELLREIASVEVRSMSELTAPANGVVAGLQLRPGSYVQPGQVLLTMHDRSDPLEARLYVSSDNAAMISVGQRVELQLRAYPHELFGTQSASVTSVSATALAARDIDVPTQITGPVFEIRATLDASTISAHGDDWQLPPGTAFDAELLRRRWPLYRWLLRSRGTGQQPRV